MIVIVVDWGVMLFSVEVLLVDGSLCWLLLGCVKLEDYVCQVVFFGVLVGCYVNCIGYSCFLFDGQVVNVMLLNDVGY